MDLVVLRTRYRSEERMHVSNQQWDDKVSHRKTKGGKEQEMEKWVTSEMHVARKRGSTARRGQPTLSRAETEEYEW